MMRRWRFFPLPPRSASGSTVGQDLLRAHASEIMVGEDAGVFQVVHVVVALEFLGLVLEQIQLRLDFTNRALLRCVDVPCHLEIQLDVLCVVHDWLLQDGWMDFGGKGVVCGK